MTAMISARARFMPSQRKAGMEVSGGLGSTRTSGNRLRIVSVASSCNRSQTMISSESAAVCW